MFLVPKGGLEGLRSALPLRTLTRALLLSAFLPERLFLAFARRKNAVRVLITS